MTRIPRPSPATLIAFAALFVALGGPSQAAQLARKVTSHHKSLRGPRGLPGPRGPAGPAGPKGAVGPAIVRSASLSTPGFAGALSGTATCLPGETATGGGVFSSQGGAILRDSPSQRIGVGPTTGWEGEAQNPAGNSAAGSVYVLCVPAS